jgi:hypothetical protein
MYSEVDNENTMEHSRLSQCDRTETHTEEVQKNKRFEHKPHYSNCIEVMTIIYSYVL